MIEISFKKDFRSFKEGEVIKLPSPVAVLVGDQGVGKSSLIKVITESKKRQDIVGINRTDDVPRFLSFFDTEKHNPRTFESFRPKISTMTQMGVRFVSHGEFIKKALLTEQIFEAGKQQIVFLDEPESGLSLRSQRKILDHWNKLIDEGHHLVVSTHSPFLMKIAKRSDNCVYDVQTRKCVDVDAYCESLFSLFEEK